MTWTRAAEPLISATTGIELDGTHHVVQEPTVIYDGTWRMWYTGGWTSPGLCYASCPGSSDPTVTGNWTKYAGNPVLGQGGSGVAGFVAGNHVVKITGSSYRAFWYDANGGGNLKTSTSANGLAWAAPTTAIAAGAVGWAPGGLANCFIWWEGGTTWKMMIEGSTTGGGGPPWRIGYATSTDGATWTVVAGPLTDLIVSSGAQCGGPWVEAVGNRYQMWYHAGAGSTSDIYRALSADAVSWTQTGVELTHNGSTYEKDQAADPSVVEKDGVSYLFYDGVNNSTGQGYINVATAGALPDIVVPAGLHLPPSIANS